MNDQENKKDDIESPYVPQAPFDYNKYRDETTVKAVSAIFKILGENSDMLAYTSTATKETILDAEDVVVKKMIMAIIENKVPEGDMQMLVETFQVVIHRLFDTIARMKKEFEREFLARALNGRNPGDNHYSREFSTLGDLYAGLERIRIEQENDPHGYFYNTPKQDAGETAQDK